MAAALFLVLVLLLGAPAKGTRPALTAAAEMKVFGMPRAGGAAGAPDTPLGGDKFKKLKEKKQRQQQQQNAGPEGRQDSGLGPAARIGSEDDQAGRWEKRKKPKNAGGRRDEDGSAWARGGAGMQALFQKLTQKAEAAATSAAAAVTDKKKKKKQKKKKRKIFGDRDSAAQDGEMASGARDLPQGQQTGGSNASPAHTAVTARPPSADAGSHPKSKQKRKGSARCTRYSTNTECRK